MKFETITDPDDVLEGDLLLIKDEQGNITFRTAEMIKEVGINDFEVILDFERNSFYRNSAFTAGESWVKEIIRVYP